jgi:hypothetical protein
MLWTDSLFITPSDLQRIDSEVASVATQESITLSGSNGTLRQAQEEAANILTQYIVAFGGYLNSGDLTANHLAAVLNVGIGNIVRQKCSLEQVVVSGNVPGEWSVVKEWAIYQTLISFYRNGFARVGGDRYKTKLDYYRSEMDRRIKTKLWTMGVPIVMQPLDAPGAFFRQNSGTWGPQNVNLVSGPGTIVGAVDVAITYVCQTQPNFYASPTNTGNAESDTGGTVTTSALASGQVILVDIDDLVPPTGAQPPWEQMVVVVSPLAATGWNVYAANPGGVGGQMWLQNLDGPIPIDTTSYTFAGNPVSGTYPLLLGQYLNRRLSIVPSRQRA